MGGAGRGSAEVSGECTDVGSSTAGDRDVELPRGAAANPPGMDEHRDGLELERCSSAGSRVRATSANLLRGIVRRRLTQRPGERFNGAIDGVRVWKRGHVCDFAREVVGGRFGAEDNGGVVDFGLARDELGESSAAAHEENEQTGRKRVEGAGMADAPRA